MLTPEREALLRELRYEDGSAVMVSYQDARNLIGEIDRLRAKVAALEEAAQRAYDEPYEVSTWWRDLGAALGVRERK